MKDEEKGQSKFFARNDAKKKGSQATGKYPNFFQDMQPTTDSVIALVKKYLNTTSYTDPRAGNGRGVAPCMSVKPKFPSWPIRSVKEQFYAELDALITGNGYTYKIIPKTTRIQIF